MLLCYKNIFSKTIISLLIIVSIGGFFRLLHFSDWMHYELDQARDFRVISTAIEKGPGELPLQGPKAAGNVYIDSDGDGEDEDKTTLRLGPLFYYLEYLSALIFGNTPVGSVVLLAILSILTIPLFYFFAREFFRQKLALILTLLLSCSLYFIVYSRFGWNPNLMPFFALLSSYALLRASREDERAGKWLLISAVGYGFLSNMHFLALVLFPIIAGTYVMVTRPKISWKYWLGAVGILLFLNIPLVLNDYKTGGENFKAFVSSLRGESDDGVPMMASMKKNVFEHAEMTWVILTGDQNISVPRVSKEGDITCNGECKHTAVKTVLALLYMIGGLASWLWLYRQEKDASKRRFLLIVGLWLSVTFIVYLPLSFEFAPRFFLFHGLTFIIFLGLIVCAAQRFGVVAQKCVYVALGLALLANILSITTYFDGMRSAFTEAQFELSYSDLILGEKTRVPLSLLEQVIDEIMLTTRTNGQPIHLEAQAEYKRAFWERIEAREDYIYDGVGDLRTQYRKGNYFVVVRTQSDFDNYFEKFAPYYDVTEIKNFGTLTLYTLELNESVRNSTDLQEIAVFDNREDPEFSSSAQVRYLWRQVFEGCTYNYDSRECE